MPGVIDEKLATQRRRGGYPRKFHKDAAALVIDQHRTIADVAYQVRLETEDVRGVILLRLVPDQRD